MRLQQHVRRQTLTGAIIREDERRLANLAAKLVGDVPHLSKKWRMGPGSYMLTEDTTGHGHRSRVVSQTPALLAAVQLVP
jgi:hypothetical protein